MLNLIRRAMHDSDELVIEMDYCDSAGRRTRRVVSPIRFLSENRFLALCLCREEPRQFSIDRCSHVQLGNAHQYLMPVPELTPVMPPADICPCDINDWSC